ncbi:MAG: hypothetical protein IKN74_04820 [Clostridia bacterium]|nr:hypothetical protein [Clostridia bacterium]
MNRKFDNNKKRQEFKYISGALSKEIDVFDDDINFLLEELEFMPISKVDLELKTQIFNLIENMAIDLYRIYYYGYAYDYRKVYTKLTIAQTRLNIASAKFGKSDYLGYLSEKITNLVDFIIDHNIGIN